MTPPRTLKVKSSLSRQLARPGGRTVAEAERLADAALQTHREDAFGELGDLVRRLERHCAEPTPAGEAEVYALAVQIIDLAGFFATGAFYDAAYSLCDLSDRSRGTGRWSWDAVRVHVDALRLLHGAGLQSASSNAPELVAGLRKLAASVAPA